MLTDERKVLLPLRNQDWKKVKLVTEEVNKLHKLISTDDITEVNNLIYAGVKIIIVKLGIQIRDEKKSKENEE